MSYETRFIFTQGISCTMYAPPGTTNEIKIHNDRTESILELKQGEHGWQAWANKFDHLSDDVLCETVERHNSWVRMMYEIVKDSWTPEPTNENTEEITPDIARDFWYGFSEIEIPHSRWSAAYYRSRMEVFYEVMRGRPTEGISFDSAPLTEQQAANVIRLFEFIDPDDQRLDVPDGHDYLASSSDGGYEWCGDGDKGCYKPIHPDDIGCCECEHCPLRELYDDTESDGNNE